MNNNFMRTITALLCLLSLLMGERLSAQAMDGSKDFTIRGEIVGLAVGDTLRFERVELPEFKPVPQFEVVVSEPGRFEYSGKQSHLEYYLMTYAPCEGKVEHSSLYGLRMLVDGGTVTVTGEREWIYFSRVSGEAFGDQPMLREAAELDNAIQKERSGYLRQAMAAYEAGDTLKGQEYGKKFNEYLPKEEDGKRLIELKKGFLQRYPSSPWSLVERLQGVSYTPLDTLTAYYDRLDATTRESYYGKKLLAKIDELKRLLPGQPAPDFQVTLPDGSTRASDSFRGKYLLIYHWGYCPGSMQREKDAVELYNRFKGHLEILGVTDNLASFKKNAEITPDDAELFGMKLKEIYQSMAAHPWIDVEEPTADNHKINELYVFAGFPYFIFISPDGKIISRGFHETFLQAKKVLEEEFGKE